MSRVISGDVDLEAILTSAEILASNTGGESEELPKTARSLRQLAEASNELLSQVKSFGQQNAQAEVLLSYRGIDLPHLAKKLNLFEPKKISLPLERAFAPDIDAYIRNEKENAIHSVLEADHRNLCEMLDKERDEELKKDAENKRSEILTCLHKLGDLDSYAPLTGKKACKLNMILKKDSVMSGNQLLYAAKLVEYHELVLDGKTPNLIHMFMSTLHASEDDKVYEMWNVLNYMSDIPVKPGVDVLKQRTTSSMIDVLITRAKRYLENKYLDHIDAIVPTGYSDCYSLIKAFVKIVIPKPYLGMEYIFVDNLPFWPVLYYSLRCGNFESAIKAINVAGVELDELVEVLDELCATGARHLPLGSEQIFTTYYRRTIRISPDPYKRLVHCALVACDLEDTHSELIKTAEDYLWLKLGQVREIDVEKISSASGTIPRHFTSLSYAQLQTIISKEYGESYFDASRQPHVYFLMLTLTSQYEAAIDALFRNDEYRVHAAHMAIALHHQQLLAISDTITRPLLSSLEDDSESTKRLNLRNFIQMYVFPFQDDVEIAIHYFYALRKVKASKKYSMFPHLVCELALRTEQYEKIFGYKKEDGTREEALIDKFTGCEASIKCMIVETAEAFEENKKLIDAIKLYFLANEYGRFLDLMNQLMGRHVMDRRESSEQIRNELHKISAQYAQQVDGVPPGVSGSAVETFHTLRQLCIFSRCISYEEYRKALEVIHDSKLMPFSLEEIDPTAKSYKSLDVLVSRAVPEILIAMMTVLCHLRDEFKRDLEGVRIELEIPGHKKARYLDDVFQIIKSQAHIVTTFASRIPFELPGYITKKIMEIQDKLLN